jgi:hypothetical protein
MGLVLGRSFNVSVILCAVERVPLTRRFELRSNAHLSAFGAKMGHPLIL